jgi:presenilin-like A22 family membrane protease
MKSEPTKIIKLLVIFIIAIEVNIIVSLYLFRSLTPILRKEVQAPPTNSLVFVITVVVYLVVFSILIIVLLKKKVRKIPLSLIDLVRLFLVVLFINLFAGILPSIITGGVLIAIENRIRKWSYSDMINIIADITIALIFALYLGIIGSILLLAALALYDYFAVFISKHMLSLAKMYQKHPEKGGVIVFMSKRYKKGLFSGALFLGNGDIAFPNVLISAEILGGHFVWGIYEAIAAIAGLLIILLFGQKGKGYPALAFIVPMQTLTQGLLLI